MKLHIRNIKKLSHVMLMPLYFSTLTGVLTVPSIGYSVPNKLNVQATSFGSLACLQGFIYIDGKNNPDLRNFLEANPSCLDSADYQDRNYQTLALESGSVEALLIVLSIQSDSRQLTRFHQKDKRSLSAFSLMMNNAEAYKPDLRALYDLGIGKQLGASGENLADIAWKAREGDLTADLAIDGIKARNKNKYEYVVHGVMESFSSFVIALVKKTNLDLSKTYKYFKPNQQTLLQISIDSAIDLKVTFDLGLLDFYVDQGAILANRKFDPFFLQGLTRLRAFWSGNIARQKEIDQRFLMLASKYPAEWFHFIENWSGSNPDLQELMASVIKMGTLDFKSSFNVFFPKLSVLTESLAADIALKETPVPMLTMVRDELLAQNRFPSKTSLRQDLYAPNLGLGNSDRSIWATETYLLGVKLKTYPVPVCRDFYTPESYEIKRSDIEAFISLGMDPRECKGVARSLYDKNGWWDNDYARGAVYLYAISNDTDVVFLRKVMESALASDRYQDVIDQVLALGYSPGEKDFLAAFNGRHNNDELILKFTNWLPDLSDAFISAKGCEIAVGVVGKPGLIWAQYDVSTIDTVVTALVQRKPGVLGACRGLLVLTSEKLAVKAVQAQLSDGADPNEILKVGDDERTPLTAVSLADVQRAELNEAAVIDMSALLLNGGADPNKIVSRFVKFKGFWFQDELLPLSLSPVLAAVFAGQTKLLDVLLKHGGNDKMSFSVAHPATPNTPQVTSRSEVDLQYLAALGVDFRMNILMGYLASGREESASDYSAVLDMLKHLISKYGPNRENYAFFPLIGGVARANSHSAFPDECEPFANYKLDSGFNLVKWARLRGRASKIKEFERQFDLMLTLYENAGGDLSDYKNWIPNSNIREDIVYYYYRRPNPDTRSGLKTIHTCWGGPETWGN